MSVIKLPQEKMLELLEDRACHIEIRLLRTSRWSTYYAFVFEYNGKLYETEYSVGATEYQDEHPWEFESIVECFEVEPVEVTKVVYERVKS